MHLSILIVNHNGIRFVSGCLESISRYINTDHEIILVDNASTDGSREAVLRDFPSVCVIPSKANIGFSAGNNLAAKHAKGNLFLLLNSDTVLLDDIQPAIDILCAFPDIGNVGALMVDGNLRYRSSAGFFPSLFRLFKISKMTNRNGFLRNGEFPQQGMPGGYPVEWLEASFFLTRSSLWKRLGGLDELFFMYGEDVDYCKRSLDLGFTTAYCPEVRYMHHGGYVPERFPLVLAGIKRYHQKHSGYVMRAFVSAILLCGIIGRIVYHGIIYVLVRSGESRSRMVACWRALISLQ